MPAHNSYVPPRWSDVDSLGHVNNVVLLRYLQEARVDMLFADAADRGTDQLARGVVVHRHQVSYLAPLRVRSKPATGPAATAQVRVDTWVNAIRPASFELGYAVMDAADSGGTVCAVASTVAVPYDLAGGHPRRLTAAEREVLAAFRPAGTPPPGERPADRAPAAWSDGGQPYAVRCAVRFDDLDSYGHVNNVVVAEYLQQARIEFSHQHLAGSRAEHEGTVVAHLSIDYLRPIPFRSAPVLAEIQVSRVGTSSFDLAYQVRDGDTVFARAASAMVAYDVAGARSRPLTDGERAALKEFSAP